MSATKARAAGSAIPDQVRDDLHADRIDALPLLDERQAFISRAIPSASRGDIDMAVMRQTPGLAPRPRAVTPDLIRGRRRARSCARDVRG